MKSVDFINIIILSIQWHFFLFGRKSFIDLNIINQLKMAIKKQYLKSKPVCKVTFSLEAKEAEKVSVIGDFNKWNEKKTALKKLKNGTFKGTVDLEKDNSYEFRYLVDGDYINDEQADAYAWNDFAAAENCVLNL